MKIALANICKDFDNASPHEEFLQNAVAHRNKVDCLINVYEGKVDPTVVDRLSQHTKVLAYGSGRHSALYDRLAERGLPAEDAENILNGGIFDQHDFLPYGAHRNAVLAAALLEDVDYLLFYDTDIYPKILVEPPDNFLDIDWVGKHLHGLQQEGVVATSSDYTGYFIIPPMPGYLGLSDLFACIQKKVDYYQTILPHNCLVWGTDGADLAPTSKILGGNLGLALKKFQGLNPFFSTYFFLDGKVVMGRGEDTLMGHSIARSESLRAVDIHTMVFHDTFGDFPKIPDLQQKTIRDRFHRACLGWIGRNPFFNWYLHHHGLAGESELEIYHRQKAKIGQVADQLAAYMQNEDFLDLPRAFEESYALLKTHIRGFLDTYRSWNALLELVFKEA